MRRTSMTWWTTSGSYTRTSRRQSRRPSLGLHRSTVTTFRACGARATAHIAFVASPLLAVSSSPQSGDVVLLPNGGFRHRGATRWAHLSNPEGWVGGPYADEDEADSHATALNDVSAFDNSPAIGHCLHCRHDSLPVVQRGGRGSPTDRCRSG